LRGCPTLSLESEFPLPAFQFPRPFSP